MEQKINPLLEESWKNILLEEFSKPYFFALKSFLQAEKKRFTVYPSGSQMFAAFQHTPFHQVKAVILGQDPYHGPGQAHGLCFSVPGGVPPPPSLKNIFKELKSDLDLPVPSHGNLTAWADQGVLLLNASLSVRANEAGSHQGKGWEIFTDKVIATLSEQREHLVFLLWGNYAMAKRSLIDGNKHLILTAAHPSPLSVTRGFFGCRHFSKTNEYLQRNGKEPINWSLE